MPQKIKFVFHLFLFFDIGGGGVGASEAEASQAWISTLDFLQPAFRRVESAAESSKVADVKLFIAAKKGKNLLSGHTNKCSWEKLKKKISVA